MGLTTFRSSTRGSACRRRRSSPSRPAPTKKPRAHDGFGTRRLFLLDMKATRVDQVGSLCAPRALKELFAEYKRGNVAEQKLDVAKDDAIRLIVREQAGIGLPV